MNIWEQNWNSSLDLMKITSVRRTHMLLAVASIWKCDRHWSVTIQMCDYRTDTQMDEETDNARQSDPYKSLW